MFAWFARFCDRRIYDVFGLVRHLQQLKLGSCAEPLLGCLGCARLMLGIYSEVSRGSEMQTHTDYGKPEFKTSFCEDYEELLGKCQNALETWTARREQAWDMGMRGRALGGELVRLQADFAKSYAVLQKHVRECPLCEFVSRIANQNTETADEALVHQIRPA
jgi:hypothetical protein